MARIRWKKDTVVSLRVKGGLWVLAQMLENPYLLFFDRFAAERSWKRPPQPDEILFCCAVTRQFLKHADLHKEKLAGIEGYERPLHWITEFHGGRELTVWPGTPHARKVRLLSSRPGGQLIIIRREDGHYVTEKPVIADIPFDDDETIDGHELAVLWTFPLLNERLFLCHQLGRVVDPGKDIQFERELPDAYRTFVDMLAYVGGPADWGYGDMAD
ncbi:MAG: hypothetical protein KC431_27775 [Myxococcales bacterium]|nr:hypothetical protein [Myxococcales bacterium]